jgi:hypothetical protein
VTTWYTSSSRWRQTSGGRSPVTPSGERWSSSYTIIDATEFFHTVADSTFLWRNEHIIPLYNQAGIQKFAFLVTAQARGTVEKCAQLAPDGLAEFPIAWFESRDRLYAWLTA